MSGKAMSLKAKIRNLAKEKNMSAQVILQNYMFERFLERLSKSEYMDNFIIKGGMLISSIVGISNRATMDLDTTIQNYPLTAEDITKAVSDICSIKLDDNMHFEFLGLETIRGDGEAGGFRASVQSKYDTIITPMQIDITTGDIITPREILYEYKMMNGEKTICVWSYNIETILAEKYETIFSRGKYNTRPRDFYDIYILLKTQNFNPEIFNDAVRKTVAKRATTHIFENIEKSIDEISKSQ